MKNTTLVSKIEKFVLSSLNHRYNPQVKVNTFLEQVNHSASEIKNYSGSIEIKINGDQRFQKYVYRLPQTRIYYSLFQNLQVKIQFIDYFNVHLIILEGTNESIRLLNKTRLQGVEIINGQPFKNVIQADLIPSNPLICFVAPKRLQNKYDSVLHLLNEIREWEYNYHPIAKLKGENNDYLKILDEDFARLNPIAQFGRANLPELDSPFLIYHLQLHLQLGHFKLLQQLLKHLCNNTKAENSIKEDILLHRFLLSFYRALELNQKTIPEWLKSVEGMIGTDEADLIKDFLFKEFYAAEDMLENLQQMWETINVPALEFYWQQKVQQNPQRFLLFLQLSLQNHFFWAEQAFEKIYEWLPDSHKPYVRLLFQLSRFTYFNPDQGCHCGTIKMLAHQQVVSFGRLQVAYHRFGKKIFSVFADVFQNLKVKLDKQVQWHFDVKQNRLTIWPVLIKPPLSFPKFDFTQIQIENLKIKLPLIWEQLALEVNQIRLKWIRKKKRFQLTVKIPKQFNGRITIDEVPVNPENVYAKYYFPISTKSTEWHVSLNDDQGIRQPKIQAKRHPLIVTGLALDERGILHEMFNFRLENSKRNRLIKGQQPDATPLSVSRVPSKFTLTARRCQPFTGQMEEFDQFVKQFLVVPAARLIHQLNVWTFEKNDVEHLKTTFSTILGFVPKIIVTSAEKFNPTAETLNILISLKAMGEEVGNYKNFKVMQTGTHSGLKYLWMKRDQLKKNLIDFYFMQKIEKI